MCSKAICCVALRRRVTRWTRKGKQIKRRVNLTNVLQLAVEFPDMVRLAAYRDPEEVTARLAEWLPGLQAER